MINRIRNFFYARFPIHNFLGKKSFEKQFTSNYIFYDNKLNFAYDLNTDIGKMLYWERNFESIEIDFFTKLIQQKSIEVLIDIGANIGWDCINWIKHTKLVNAYAFEPSIGTRSILEFNKKMNGLQNLTIVPKAMSDQKGFCTFYDSADNAYSSLKDTQRKKIVQHYDVEVTTLNSFVQELAIHSNKKFFVKIDVEGFENEVIAGGLDFIKQNKPELFIEIYQGNNSNKNPNFIFEKLSEIGYKSYFFQETSLISTNGYLPAFYNYYFTCDN